MTVKHLIKHIFCALLVLGAIGWLTVFKHREGADIAGKRHALVAERPETVLIGNSVLKAGIDEVRLSAMTGSSTLKATSNGSASAWWYLYVRNVICASEHKPKRVLIFYRDGFLTEPTFRTTGRYRTPLRRLSTDSDPLLWEKAYGGHPDRPWIWGPAEAKARFERRLMKIAADLVGVNKTVAETALAKAFDGSLMRQDVLTRQQLAEEVVADEGFADFEAQLEQSLLPAILDMLDAAGIDAVFVRNKRRRDVDPDAEPTHIKRYTDSLAAYLQRRGAQLIDMTHESAVQLEHYGPGDHLNAKGKQVLTHALAERLNQYDGDYR